MPRNLPTASALERAFRCIGSAVLPRVGSTSEYAERGIQIHAFLEAVNKIGRDAALAAIEDEDMRAICAEIDLAALPVDPACYRAEVTFAFDVSTGVGRVLGESLGRDYSAATALEIVGTADVVGLLGDDRACVLDYKTGRSELPEPSVNRQLRFLALAAARAYGRNGAVVELVRLREDGSAWRQRAELDAFDLAEIAEELRRLAYQILAAGDVPPLSIGAHCRGCHSVSFCPAQTGLLRALVAEPEASFEGMVAQLTPTQAPKAYEQYKALEALVDRLGDNLKTYARENPIALPDGRVYEEVTEPRKSLVGAAVWHVLRERFGDEAAWNAVKLTATQAAIKDLAGAAAVKRGDKKALEEELMGELARRGGIKVHEIKKFTAHRAKENR